MAVLRLPGVARDVGDHLLVRLVAVLGPGGTGCEPQQGGGSQQDKGQQGPAGREEGESGEPHAVTSRRRWGQGCGSPVLGPENAGGGG